MTESRPSRNPETRLPYRWVILILSVLVVLGALGFGRFGFTMVLPQMKAALRLSESRAGILVTFSLVGYLLSAVACGPLVSLSGPKIVIVSSLGILSISLLFIGVTRSYPAALVFCLTAGIGSGGANVAGMGLAASWFTRERRGMATGIVTSGSSFGILISGIIVPVFLKNSETSGWRNAWIFMAASIFIIALLCLFFLKNRPHIHSDEEKSSRGKSAGGMKLGLVYKSRAVWHLAGIYVAFGFSYIIYTTFFADFLAGEIGLSITVVGKIWSGVGALSMISGFVWGIVSDRLGRKYGLAMVFFIQSVCYFLFRFSSSGPCLYISAFLFAVTSWSIPAIMAAAAGDLMGEKLAAAAFGFITLFFGVGQAFGPFAAGWIAGSAESLGPVFFITAGAAFIGAAGSLLIKPSPGQLK